MFFEGFGVRNGSQLEENLTKMAMLSPSWAVLGDLGCKLGCLGRCWKQDGAQWSDHERQDEPPEAPRWEMPVGVREGVRLNDLPLTLGPRAGLIQFTDFIEPSIQEAKTILLPTFDWR